jgi:phenylalanyl-tRNA synthetase beta chain
MKISYNWLKKYLDFNLSVNDTADILTDIGLEVESTELFEPIKGGLKGVVVGKVVNCVKHPDADKLHVTKVDIGNIDLLQIVCGAPNVALGQTVLVATIGSVLYFSDGKELEIKKAKIRGIPSEGMICAEDELGIGDSHDGILILADDIPVGTKASELFYTANDFIFEIGLTPNRTDAMSHYGVARDLAAALTKRKRGVYKAFLPEILPIKTRSIQNPIEIVVKDAENCPRYAGVYIKNLQVGDSPNWLKYFLKSMGMKPINNIVDITNFVMLETGQPLHAFDAAKIKGEKIVVRPNKAETFVTLDEVKRKMSGRELMICNEKEEMCIAGIFGGLDSGVSVNTKSIFLESAYFNPVSVRKSSKYHGLKTDSSFRFERGADPEMVPYALFRAAQLISEICPNVKYSKISDVYPNPMQRVKIACSYDAIAKLIGKDIPSKIILSIMESLDFEIVAQGRKGFEVLAPLYRVDVTRESDVVEEILRIYGFNSVEVPETLNYSLAFSDKLNIKKEQYKEKVSNFLSANGFYEAMNNSLTKLEYAEKFDVIKIDEIVKVLNPLSKDLELLRQSLLPGLLENLLLNQNYQTQNVFLYEFGKEYSFRPLFQNMAVEKKYSEKEVLALLMSGNEKPENWKYPAVKVDFYNAKKYVDQIISSFGVLEKLTTVEVSNGTYSSAIKYVDSLNNVYAVCSVIHPRVLKHFDIKQPVYYAEFVWSKLIDLSVKKSVKYNDVVNFQPVRRDLALLLDENISYKDVKDLAECVLDKLLKDVNLFDVYQGDKLPANKKSYAVSFVLQDSSKTMTDNQITKLMDKLVVTFKEKLGAELR